MRAILMTCAVAMALMPSVFTRQAHADDVVLGSGIGSKVQVQIKKGGNPVTDSIKYAAKDPAIAFTPGSGAVDDPVTNGASMVVFSANDCQCLSLAPVPTVVPGWTQAPASGTPTKYKWKDQVSKSSAQVSAGKIKVTRKGDITYGLDVTPQGDIEVQLVFGSSTSAFSGDPGPSVRP